MFISERLFVKKEKRTWEPFFGIKNGILSFIEIRHPARFCDKPVILSIRNKSIDDRYRDEKGSKKKRERRKSLAATTTKESTREQNVAANIYLYINKYKGNVVTKETKLKHTSSFSSENVCCQLERETRRRRYPMLIAYGCVGVRIVYTHYWVSNPSLSHGLGWTDACILEQNQIVAQQRPCAFLVHFMHEHGSSWWSPEPLIVHKPSFKLNRADASAFTTLYCND